MHRDTARDGALPRLVARRSDEVDQHSTLKIGTGLVAYPVWAIGLTAAAFAAFRSKPARALATGVILASPFAALRWLDAWYQRGGEATADELAKLSRLRIAARTAIDEARSRLPS